jgi:hypothetical protein
MKKLPKNHSSGQAVLIILLVMAVVLTIGLSVVSRSVTDINISQQSEDSARAFSAAEAGIEQALIGTSADRDFEFNFTESSAKISSREVAFGHTWYIYPSEVATDQIVTVWLGDYNNTTGDYTSSYTGNRLRVYWGNPDTPNNNKFTPAMEVSIYYKDGAAYKVGKYLLDPYSGRIMVDKGFCDPNNLGGSLCTGIFSFSNVKSSIGTPAQEFQFNADLDMSNFVPNPVTRFPLFARLRLLYSTNDSHFVGVLSSGAGSSLTFPSQGKDITAVGSSGVTSRKVVVFRPKPAPPAIFDFALYSGTELHHEP